VTRNAYLPLKRLADIFFALLLGLMLLPLLVAVAIAIRLESPGGAIFRQVRMGRLGQRFTIYKFRSMVADAPRLGPELTARNDPRITPLGRLLRRSSVDEFPQLWNILKGDMSFIGPRPEVPSIVEADWTPDDRARVLAVRPGLTGWAQIHGRDDLDIPTKLAYDREYARRVSAGLDLAILWRTPWILLTGQGIK